VLRDEAVAPIRHFQERMPYGLFVPVCRPANAKPAHGAHS
jgi:hypothetical protein